MVNNQYRIQIVRNRSQYLQLYSILKQSLPIDEARYISVDRLENKCSPQLSEGVYFYYLFKTGIAIIGEFHIYNIRKENLIAQVGFGILPEYQQPLYSSILVLLIIDFVFCKSNFSKIFWHTRTDNIRAIKLWKNVGAMLLTKDDHSTYWELKRDTGLKILCKYGKIYSRLKKCVTWHV